LPAYNQHIVNNSILLGHHGEHASCCEWRPTSFNSRLWSAARGAGRTAAFDSCIECVKC